MNVDELDKPEHYPQEVRDIVDQIREMPKLANKESYDKACKLVLDYSIKSTARMEARVVPAFAAWFREKMRIRPDHYRYMVSNKELAKEFLQEQIKEIRKTLDI